MPRLEILGIGSLVLFLGFTLTRMLSSPFKAFELLQIVLNKEISSPLLPPQISRRRSRRLWFGRTMPSERDCRLLGRG